MGPAVNMIDEARSFARKDWKICYAAWLYTSRGISIWKIGRASIGMEISSVTEPTIINLGKQCAETKEYFFFFFILLPLVFNNVRMHHERVQTSNHACPRRPKSKIRSPIFPPFLFSSFSVSLFPFHLPLSCSLQQQQRAGFRSCARTFVPRRIKAGRPEPWEIRDK